MTPNITSLTLGILLAISINGLAQVVSTVQFASAGYSVNENACSITRRNWGWEKLCALR